jgi:hypothetical protein
MVAIMVSECGTPLDVPESMRDAALEFPSNGRSAEDTMPDSVTCELDKHQYGDHIALLRDLGPNENDGAVWVAWCADGSDVKVQGKRYCPSKSPSKEDACWLHTQHRGGHSWERYE